MTATSGHANHEPQKLTASRSSVKVAEQKCTRFYGKSQFRGIIMPKACKFWLNVLFLSSTCGMSIAAPETNAEAGMKIRTEHFRIEVDDKGSLSGLIAEKTRQDYLPADVPAPLLSIVLYDRETDDENHASDAALRKGDGRLELQYSKAGVRVTLASGRIRRLVSVTRSCLPNTKSTGSSSGRHQRSVFQTVRFCSIII